MKFNMVTRISFIFLLAILGGCLFDPGSFFGAGSPDARFEKSATLPVPVSPSVTDTSHFRFLVISDVHYGRYDSALIKAELFRDSVAYDFLIVDGDMTQTGSTSEWDQLEHDRSFLKVPSYFVIGNHDLFHDGQDNFYSYFGPTHYSLRVGNLLLLIFDTANGVTSQKTKEWYESQLIARDGALVLGFTHYSYLSKKVEQMVALPNPEEFYWLVNTNATFGVSAMISGHLHHNLQQDFRGTHYYTVTNSAHEEEPQGLLVTYFKGNLSFERVVLPQ